MASKVLLIAVFICDLIAFSLAVAAEQRRTSARVDTDANSQTSYCVYDSNGATGLGVGSFLLLMASQALIMVATKCLCCGRALRPSRSRTWAIVLFITCWFTFFIAEVCLLAGSVRNAYHTKYRAYLSEHPLSCETLRRGVFGAGAAFIVFTGIASELFYVSYTKNDDGFVPRDDGIRMGTL